MPISARHVVLYAVEQVSGKPNGKTYIQKLCFFVSQLLNEPLGFRAHYYGPYSDQISAELSFLTGSGLVTETRRSAGVTGSSGWEIARFDYALSDDGRRAVAHLAARLPEEASLVRQAIQKVFSAGEQNYVELSFAAKTKWILESQGGPMTADGISQAAGRFNWDVSGTDVGKAANFLEKLGLVQLRQ